MQAFSGIHPTLKIKAPPKQPSVRQRTATSAIRIDHSSILPTMAFSYPSPDRHDADGVFWTAVDDSVRISQVHQNRPFFIVKTHHLGRLEDG